MSRLRITDQRLGGIETPRLNVPGIPHAPPRKRGGQNYASVDRYRAAIIGHVVGA
jgi:hypothetical protein